jgi:hypothetical protein
MGVSYMVNLDTIIKEALLVANEVKQEGTEKIANTPAPKLTTPIGISLTKLAATLRTEAQTTTLQDVLDFASRLQRSK